MNAEYIDLLVTTHYIFLDVIAVNQPRYGLVTKGLAGSMLNHMKSSWISTNRCVFQSVAGNVKSDGKTRRFFSLRIIVVR